MELNIYNSGACGLCQLFHVGTISFDTDDIANGVAIASIPKGAIVTRAIVNIAEAFNAATTNVLTIGIDGDFDAIVDSTGITEGSTGINSIPTFFKMEENQEIYAQFTQTGTEASTGIAEIYFEVVFEPLT